MLLFIVVLSIILVYILCGFKKIPTGHKGIILWFGAKSETVFDAGLTWLFPLFNTLEIIDCRVRFIEERNMTISLAHFISVNLKTSIHYKVDNPSSYLDNYSKSDFDGKVKTYVTNSLREYLTKNEVTDQEIISMNTSGYKQEQIKKINEGYISNLGLKITDIVVVIIEITPEMKNFFELLRQADLLHLELPYNAALEKVLLINGKYSQTDFNLSLKGLGQLKRLVSLG